MVVQVILQGLHGPRRAAVAQHHFGEIDGVVEKLGRIVSFVDQLQAADTGSVAPMAHPLDMAQRLRADEVTEPDRRDDYQRNSAAVADGFYTVPRVIE